MRPGIITRIAFVALALLTLTGWAANSPREIPADAQCVAELLSDAYRTETLLLVELKGDVQLDGTIYIETRDQTSFETSQVMHLFGSYLILKTQLDGDYLLGSKIYQ